MLTNQIIGQDGKILKTSDGGATWSQMTSGTNNELRCVWFCDYNNGYIGGSMGTILKSTSIGLPVELASFIASVINNEVHLNWITSTEINNSGFEIIRLARNDNEWEKIGFVSGFGTTTEPKSYSFTDKNITSGVYKYRLKQINFDGSYEYSKEIEVEVNITPQEYALNQNYPNPFNPTTIISYRLPVISNVVVKVYDILGQEVMTLVNGKQEAGSHSVNFCPSGINSGIYFYTIEATGSNGKNFSSTKKMMILK